MAFTFRYSGTIFNECGVRGKTNLLDALVLTDNKILRLRDYLHLSSKGLRQKG